MKKLAVLIAAAIVTSAIALAQNDARAQPASQFYRLDFVIKEIESGKPVKTHNYQMMANYRGVSSIRSGAKVPVGDGKTTTYIDIGVNLDVKRLVESKDGSGLELDIVAEVSGALDAGGAQLTKTPMIYETKWTSNVEIPIGKATTVFSSDDPTSKRQLQLEVTATPLH